MSRLTVVERLSVEIYGLRAEIGFASREDAREVSKLLRMFTREEIESTDLTINYLKKERAQEIAVFLIPALARMKIWAVHAGGIHYQGGVLIVGPSDSGKSTFSYMALRNGFTIVSDDITLLRETEEGIGLLPFFSAIFWGGREITPELGSFEPANLKYILFPQKSEGSDTIVRKIDRKSEVAKKLIKSFLWAFESEVQEEQKKFIEKLSAYPAFEVDWNATLFNDPSYFKRILDEVIQS
jgi:hypothetical protein